MKGYIAQQAVGDPTRLAFVRYTGAPFAVAVGVFGLGHGVLGQVWQTRHARWIADVAQESDFVRSGNAAEAGFHGATAFPILVGNDTIGVIEFFSQTVRQPDPEELETLSALGSQIGQVIERRRAEEERERLLVREQAAHAEAAASQQRFRDLVNSIEGIVWAIEDSGRGFDLESLERRAGLGFVSMRERLRVLRGTVRVDSAPSRGTRIDVWVPAASLAPVTTGEAAHGAL